MITSSDNFLARQMDGAMVFTLSRPDFIDSECIRRTGEDIHACTRDEDRPRVIVDFQNVRFLSSAALGMLVALQKTLKELRWEPDA